jgi:hypothetical protein
VPPFVSVSHWGSCALLNWVLGTFDAGPVLAVACLGAKTDHKLCVVVPHKMACGPCGPCGVQRAVHSRVLPRAAIRWLPTVAAGV